MSAQLTYHNTENRTKLKGQAQYDTVAAAIVEYFLSSKRGVIVKIARRIMLICVVS